MVSSPVKVPLEKSRLRPCYPDRLPIGARSGGQDKKRRRKGVSGKKLRTRKPREDLGEFFNGWQFDIEKTALIEPRRRILLLSRRQRRPLVRGESKSPRPCFWTCRHGKRTPSHAPNGSNSPLNSFCLRDRADSLFSAIEKRYIDVKSKASSSGSSPSVLSSLPYHGVWYMPDGGSYKKCDVPGCRTTFSLGRQQRHRLACPGFRNGNEQRFRCPGMVFSRQDLAKRQRSPT